MILRLLTVFLIVFSLGEHAYAAQPWTIKDGSVVGFQVKQAGAPVEGVFDSFEATILFDPDDPENSTARVVIHMDSVNSQSSERDDTIRTDSLFGVETWPVAVFEAESFSEGENPGQFLAIGTLTIRDVTKNVIMPFQLSTDGNNAHAVGSLDIMRLDYGVGQGMWMDTTIVANEVTIMIDIHATR